MDEIQWAEALRGFSFDAPDTLTPERPNVFRIAGFPQREQVSSNMLAWLFDPQGNHGLGALAVETLLSLIGRTDATADEATVDTEVTTDGGKRIDILVCTPDLAVAVENKVDAWLYNDLADYRAHAAKTNGTEAVVVVLSPHHQENLDEYEKQGFVVDGNLFEVLYDKLFAALLARLGSRIMNAEPRGVDLLMQYIDNYSAERNENVMKEENDAIRRFTESTRHIGREIIAFRQAFDEYVEASKRILIQLTGDIEGRVREGLSDPEGNAVLVRELWHWPSQKSAYYGMTFHLDGQGRDVSIELITDTNPSHIADWTRDDCPIALGQATFDSLICKAYYEVGGHKKQKDNRLDGEPFIRVLDGVGLSKPAAELCAKTAEHYRRILEKAWHTELSWSEPCR